MLAALAAALVALEVAVSCVRLGEATGVVAVLRSSISLSIQGASQEKLGLPVCCQIDAASWYTTGCCEGTCGCRTCCSGAESQNRDVAELHVDGRVDEVEKLRSRVRIIKRTDSLVERLVLYA